MIKVGTLKHQILSVVIACLPMFQTYANNRCVSYVNPFIGTGAVESSLSGNNFPGATTPFAMVQLSPDTRNFPDWGQASGYDYNDKTIYGFSHTHLSGTGVAELFDLLVMPFAGSVDNAVNLVKSDKGIPSDFSHQDEKASPGYYQVMLKTYGVNAELTSTNRTGYQRYTFPKDADAHVLVDLNHSANKGSWSSAIPNSQIKIVDPYTIEGYRIITGWAKLRKIYFSMHFSKPITGNTMINGWSVNSNLKCADGNNLKIILDFSNAGNAPLLVKTGISPVSVENARLNLAVEVGDRSFDAVKDAACDLWEKELSKVKVEGTPEQMEIFYTALYHCFIHPNTFFDVNGEYMKPDFSIGRIDPKSEGAFATFSLWDTYRSAHPLYTILQPQKTAGFVNTLIEHFAVVGYMPVWQLWGQDNFCMIGNHAIPVVVDAVLKGLPGIDAEKAYEAVRGSSINSHVNSPFDVWDKYGYMPENVQSQSVSITLEMAYDDWCVAQLAKKLGKSDDFEYFTKRSKYYRNLFNSKTGFFQSKDDRGEWIHPFDPLQYGANGGNPFTEGNAWQYYWYVPHDVDDLIALTGGGSAFNQKLEMLFSLNTHIGDKNSNASGFIGQYAHGNEPSHHVAYLFDYSGEPWRTQYFVNKIMSDFYNTSSSGYAGNEDCGQMSSWFVFSSLGFYPVNPASGVYAIGTPLFKTAEICLSGGKTLTIEAPNVSKENIYIQSVLLNNKPLVNCYLTQNQLMAGGVLVFEMGDKPSKKWGVKPEARPINNAWK